MDPVDYQTILRKLGPDEQLLWVGRPRQGLRLPKITWGSVITALIICAIPIVFLTLAIVKDFYFGFFFAAVFCFISTTNGIVPTIKDRTLRSRELYGLSNVRAVVLTTTGRKPVQSVRMSTMLEVKLKHRGGNIGTIECISSDDYWLRRNKKGEIKRLPLFRLIVDAPHVYELINSSRPASSSSSVPDPRLFSEH